MAKKDDSIAIVLNNKDVCRIIPFAPDNGKNELKINFLDNPYEVSCYPLFSREPLSVITPELQNYELTYHKGKNNKPIIIHLKRKDCPAMHNRYINLPIKRIVAPNVNQYFPLPIMKLEIPSSAVNKKYRYKNYHKIIHLENCNVIELYLVNKGFDMNAFMNKYPVIHLAQMMLSFEFYATNSVLTDYQKYKYILPRAGTRNIMTTVNLLSDIQIIATYFFDPELDKKQNKIKVTFIENKIAEGLLMFAKVVYPKVSKNGVYESIYIGPTTLKDLKKLSVLPMRPFEGYNSLIFDSLERNMLSEKEKKELIAYSWNIRNHLIKVMECCNNIN